MNIKRDFFGRFIYYFLLPVICFLSHSLLPVYAQESDIKLSFSSGFTYNLQKYTGFNNLIEFLTETIIKILIKIKTRAKDADVKLEVYSGWDLLFKKAKSLYINAENLLISGIPIDSFKLVIDDPIYFKGKKIVYPARADASLQINLGKTSEILNNLPKWQKILKDLELQIPPFGSTRISLEDLNINVNDNGKLGFSSKIRSLIDPDSETLSLKCTGNLALVNKRLVVEDLKTEIEDIFTADSDISRSFSKFLEDLINPVFDFHKCEKKGLRIDFVYLSYEPDSLILDIKAKLIPKNDENKLKEN